MHVQLGFSLFSLRSLSVLSVDVVATFHSNQILNWLKIGVMPISSARQFCNLILD